MGGWIVRSFVGFLIWPKGVNIIYQGWSSIKIGLEMGIIQISIMIHSKYTMWKDDQSYMICPISRHITSYFNVIINLHFSGGVFDMLVPMPTWLGMSFKRNHIWKATRKLWQGCHCPLCIMFFPSLLHASTLVFYNHCCCTLAFNC
jgi:hypothetical protein